MTSLAIAFTSAGICAFAGGGAAVGFISGLMGAVGGESCRTDNSNNENDYFSRGNSTRKVKQTVKELFGGASLGAIAGGTIGAIVACCLFDLSALGAGLAIGSAAAISAVASYVLLGVIVAGLITYGLYKLVQHCRPENSSKIFESEDFSAEEGSRDASSISDID